LEPRRSVLAEKKRVAYFQMAHLSFSDDRKHAGAIAIVRGGDSDGDIVYVHSDDKPSNLPKSVTMSYDQPALSHLKAKDRRSVSSRIQGVLQSNADDVRGVYETSAGLYRRLREEKDKATAITLPADAHFEIVPNCDETVRSIFFITGASGSGKFTIGRMIAANYVRLFPNRNVYLISKVSSDPAFDTMMVGKPKRVDVSSLVDDPLPYTELADSLVIMDDVDTFATEEKKAVSQLCDDICALGRHVNVSLCFLTHRLTDYKATRLILNEATHFVVYPGATSYHALSYLLKTHMGMTAHEIQDLKRMGSRWVMISKIPRYILSEHSVKLLL